MLTPKKQAPVKPTGVTRKATEDPNYVNLMKKLGKMGNGGTTPKPTGVTRKATEDPNYVNLMKKLGKMRKGGVKGKKVVEKATKETYKSKAAMMKHEKGESKKTKMKEKELPAFLMKGKKPMMRNGGKTGAQLKKEGAAMKAKGQAMKAKGQAMRLDGIMEKWKGESMKTQSAANAFNALGTHIKNFGVYKKGGMTGKKSC